MARPGYIHLLQKTSIFYIEQITLQFYPAGTADIFLVLNCCWSATKFAVLSVISVLLINEKQGGD